MRGMEKGALYWKSKNEKIKCELCPHECIIGKGKRGICGVRENRNGKLYSLIYNSTSSIAVDPIEKKPLYHFHPSSNALSLGTAGCNLKCKHCQNYSISQSKPEKIYLRDISAKEAVEKAKDSGCEGIAWTYNEPIIWYEYTLDSAKLAKKEGLYTVYVTNGYINEEPLREIAPYLDAASIDVKSMNDEFYREIAGGSVQPVLKTCELAKELGIHIEIIYLVIPTKNDSDEEIKEFCGWIIENLGEDTPTHFSAFYPHYRMTDLPPTSLKSLLHIYELAKKEGIKYPYLGNVPHGDYENTYCPNCGNLLIERYGFTASIKGLKDKKCDKCGKEIPIIL